MIKTDSVAFCYLNFYMFQVLLHSAVHSNRQGAFFIRKMLIFFLFLHEKICCGYSLEGPRRGASNECPQHMFSWRNKKNIMWIPPSICSYGCQLVGSLTTYPGLQVRIPAWPHKFHGD